MSGNKFDGFFVVAVSDSFSPILSFRYLNYLHICALILSAIILNAKELFLVTCLHWIWCSSTDCVFTFIHCVFKKNISNICLWINIAVSCLWDREIPQYWENSDRYIWHRWRCTCWMCPGVNEDHPEKWKVSNRLQSLFFMVHVMSVLFCCIWKL